MRRYDIQAVLDEQAEYLVPKLAGKIWIDTDDHEAYFLSGAVKSLRRTLDLRGCQASVVIHPGHGHGSYMTDAFLREVNNQMADVFLRTHPAYPVANHEAP
ncbi:MAG: hypothetical protein KDA61_11835 [Planctomycetales bacterium]|nr:hypothetical protein [Planctomycetales bacterium]